MNRFDLQKMAEERVADAAALLHAGRFQAAYYLCGYAIEWAEGVHREKDSGI
jgi:hypothetical protein